MSFIETPRFPECVSLGALSKPRYKTSVIPVFSGYKSRNIEWANALHSFDFSHNAMTQYQHDSLLDFFHAMKAMGHQFRVRDPGDYATTVTSGALIPLNGTAPLAVSGGYGISTMLAAKKYTAGALSTYRWLQKLVSGTTTVYRGGSPVTAGGGAGQVAIDVNTGRVTFVADQSRAISTHNIGTVHQLILASAFSPNLVAGNRVYVSGVTGTAAILLNGLSHEISSILGSTMSLVLNTAGLTASGGTAFYYPQSSETLSIVTEFDVPCMFSSDEANFDLFEKTASEYLYRWSGINLEEDRIPLV